MLVRGSQYGRGILNLLITTVVRYNFSDSFSYIDNTYSEKQHTLTPYRRVRIYTLLLYTYI